MKNAGFGSWNSGFSVFAIVGNVCFESLGSHFLRELVWKTLVLELWILISQIAG